MPKIALKLQVSAKFCNFASVTKFQLLTYF
jgi:hypothetical protein